MISREITAELQQVLRYPNSTSLFIELRRAMYHAGIREIIIADGPRDRPCPSVEIYDLSDPSIANPDPQIAKSQIKNGAIP